MHLEEVVLDISRRLKAIIYNTYMVASGLPERNGDRHAAEIANLCLELIAITPSIMVMHDPSMRLKIR